MRIPWRFVDNLNFLFALPERKPPFSLFPLLLVWILFSFLFCLCAVLHLVLESLNLELLQRYVLERYCPLRLQKLIVHYCELIYHLYRVQNLLEHLLLRYRLRDVSIRLVVLWQDRLLKLKRGLIWRVKKILDHLRRQVCVLYQLILVKIVKAWNCSVKLLREVLVRNDLLGRVTLNYIGLKIKLKRLIYTDAVYAFRIIVSRLRFWNFFRFIFLFVAIENEDWLGVQSCPEIYYSIGIGILIKFIKSFLPFFLQLYPFLFKLGSLLLK